jgi:hypothetical protein
MFTSVVIRACEIRNFFPIFSTPTGGLGTVPGGLSLHTGYVRRHNYTKQKKINAVEPIFGDSNASRID